MDRRKLDLLIARANAFANNLRGTRDTNEIARQRCLHFATDVSSFTKAWSNLARALNDPQLRPRPAFSQLFDRILDDCMTIINDLAARLSDVKTKQAPYNDPAQSKKLHIPRRKTVHLLVDFFGHVSINVRQQQILYAISALDVLLGVVLHAKTLGYEPSTRQDAQTSLQDQLARLKDESDARALVFQEERRFGNKYVVSSRWFDSVTWDSDSFNVPPFETLALQWFLMAPEEVQNPNAPGVGTHHELARVVKQLQQDMREQNRRHDEEIRKRVQQHEELRSWAEGTITQIEFSQQKTKREADSRIEEMKAQLEVQKQKIESDAATIRQLRYSQREWGANFQRQSSKVEQLESQVIQQQAKLESLQEKHDKLQESNAKFRHQNQALRQRLEDSETQRRELEAENVKLQSHYSKAINAGKRWRDLYETGPGEREVLIEELQEDIRVFKAEIASLRSDLANVTGSRDELRQSLTNVEKSRDRYRERLAGMKPPCQPAYDNVTSPHRHRSRSRHSSDGTTSSARASSRESASRSRTSSATFVNDHTSDSEYDVGGTRKRASGSAASHLQSWFSTKPRKRTLVVSNR